MSVAEQELDSRALNKLPRHTIVAICKAAGIEPSNMNREELIRELLKAAGYKHNAAKKAAAAPPTPRELGPADYHFLHKKYLADEIFHMQACVHGLADLEMALAIMPDKSQASKKEVSEAIARTLKELRYYMGHSNIAPLANMYNALNPDAKLSL